MQFSLLELLEVFLERCRRLFKQPEHVWIVFHPMHEWKGESHFGSVPDAVGQIVGERINQQLFGMVPGEFYVGIYGKCRSDNLVI